MNQSNQTINYPNYSSIDYKDPIPNAVKFYVYLILLIPSMICSILSLHSLLRNRKVRHALHNHAIIIFLFICLIYQVTTYPWMLYYYHHDGIWKRTSFFCSIWIFIDYGLYFTQTILFAWAAIERHILVFHDRWVSTRKKRLLVHYLPITILTLYCLIYYIVCVFYPPCENIFNDTSMICIVPCLTNLIAMSTFEVTFNQILPNSILVIFSVGLVMRIHWQRHSAGQPPKWRRHWRMTVQLLFLSAVYLVIALPLTFLYLLNIFVVPRYQTYAIWEYILFLDYCMILLSPVAFVLSLPQLRKRRNQIVQLLNPTRPIPVVS